MPPGPPSSSGAAWHRADSPTHRWRAVGCKMPFRAAPKGAWLSLQGGRYYKHGAPNGAEPSSVVEDTYKVPVRAWHHHLPWGRGAMELSLRPFHFGCGLASLRLRVECGRQRAGSKESGRSGGPARSVKKGFENPI